LDLWVQILNPWVQILDFRHFSWVQILNPWVQILDFGRFDGSKFWIPGRRRPGFPGGGGGGRGQILLPLQGEPVGFPPCSYKLIKYNLKLHWLTLVVNFKLSTYYLKLHCVTLVACAFALLRHTPPASTSLDGRSRRFTGDVLIDGGSQPAQPWVEAGGCAWAAPPFVVHWRA
jgi:hypothetical protein